MKFMLDRQTADGGWYDPEFHPTGVEITAHLIQDSIVADLLLGDEFNVRECCRKGVMKLLSVQAADGSWDGENVDHTMDCTRSIMLVCSVLGMRAQCDRAILRSEQCVSPPPGAADPGDTRKNCGRERVLHSLSDARLEV